MDEEIFRKDMKLIKLLLVVIAVSSLLGNFVALFVLIKFLNLA